VTATAEADTTHTSRRRLRERISWELVLVLVLQAAFLWNLMRTGYLADDALNSSFTGGLQAQGMTFLHAANAVISSWIHHEGRWFPVGWYTGYAQMHLNHSLTVYKATVLVQGVAASASIWWLARELRASRRTAALVVLAITVLTQFRLSNDPHISFGGLTQEVMIEIALSAICYQRWLVRRRTGYVVASLTLFALAASTYEGVYALGPLYVLLVLRERRGLRAWALATLPIAVVSVFFLGLGAYLRAHATVGTTGPYAPRFDLREIAITAFDQTVGAVPLTFALFDPQRLFSDGRPSLIGGLGVADVLIGLAAGVTAGVLLARRERRTDWAPWQMGLFGLGLWLLTALPIALAARYQAELYAGLAHVPVYFGEIGLALVVVSVLGGIGRLVSPRRQRSVAIAGGVLVAALAMLQHRSNEAVVAAVVPEKQLRQFEEHALAAGLLADVSDRDVLYLTAPTPWQTPGFYRQHSGKTFDVRDTTQATMEVPPRTGLGCGGSTELGRVWLGGKVEGSRGWMFRTCQDAPGQRGTTAYVHGIDLSRAWISGVRLRRDGGAAAFGGPAGALLRAIPGRPGIRALGVGTPVDPRTLALDTAPGRVQIVPVRGCYQSEVAPPADARWCERTAELRVVDRERRARAATLRLTIAATGPRARRLTTTTSAGRRVHPARPGTAVAVRVPLDASGAGTVRLRIDARRLVAEGDPRTMYLRLTGLSATLAG
jgi:hypothetical protein